MRERIRLLFIGTSEFAVPALEALFKEENIELVGVITQPDKPVGRKQILEGSPIKEKAKELKIKIFQPEKLREEAEEILNETKPELIIVASYGQILPKSLLDYPKYKALNIHASLLPELRGATPIPMAILKRFEETGVTIMLMTEGLDEGGIVAKSEYQTTNNETTETLTAKLAEVGSKLLVKVLPDWLDGKIEAEKQDDSLATYVYMKDVAKERAEIKKDTKITEAERMVRAFYPWPVAWKAVRGDGKRLKIFKAKVSKEKGGQGELFVKEKELYLGLKGGSLRLLEVQLEGKNRGSGKSYLYLAQ